MLYKKMGFINVPHFFERGKIMKMTRRDFLKMSAASILSMVAASKLSLDTSNVYAEGSDDSAYGSHLIGESRAINKKVDIVAPQVKIKYDVVDSHLHFLDFIGKTDGFQALCKAMDMSGVSKSVIFGMPIAKQWDDSMKEPPSYYLSNDSRCYYYSATDYILAENLCKNNVLSLIKTY